jgi:hypothetical protein
MQGQGNHAHSLAAITISRGSRQCIIVNSNKDDVGEA